MLPMFWEWKYIEYVLNIFYGKLQTCRVPLIKGNDTLRNFIFALMRKNGRIIVTHNYFGTLFVRPELSHAIGSVAILISMVPHTCWNCYQVEGEYWEDCRNYMKHLWRNVKES